ncbi:MAG: type III secretion system export apparatus subunit SctU [Bryobacteraceae bacterium]
MAGEKTEQPTEKKLRESREKGQVGKSADLTNAFLFLAAAGVLSLGGGAYVIELRSMMKEFFRPEALGGDLPPGPVIEAFGAALLRALVMTLPLAATVAMVAAALQFLQVKALFSPQVIQPKFDKLNPVQGFQNIFFKAKTYVELLKNLVKLAVIAALVYYNLHGDLREVLLSVRVDPASAASLAGNLLFRLFYQVGGAFIVIGAADYMLQNKFHMKELMMSKEEVKREYKESEGDQHIKHARKQFHEEMLSHSAVSNVPQADAVIVNPTHLAIAIRYDEATMGAPTVTAKGREELAQRIRELAAENRVPVVHNVPLARSLYAVDLGAEIPEDLYEPVAEILQWVYRMAEGDASANPH